MLGQETAELTGDGVPSPAASLYVGRKDDVLGAEAHPGRTEVVLGGAGVTVVLTGIVLEDVLAAEVAGRTEEDGHVADELVVVGVDDCLQGRRSLAEDGVVFELLAVPESDLALVGESRMLGDACAEGLMATDAGDGGKSVGRFLEIGEAPFDDLLGVAVTQLVFLRCKEMVYEGRGSPQTRRLEHADGAEELGLGLHAGDLGAVAFDLFEDGVAEIDAPVDALIHNSWTGVRRCHDEVSGIAERVGIVGYTAAAHVMVVTEDVQKDVVLDAAHVVEIRAVNGGYQLIRLGVSRFSIVGAVIEDALLRDVELVLAGCKAQAEHYD